MICKLYEGQLIIIGRSVINFEQSNVTADNKIYAAIKDLLALLFRKQPEYNCNIN